MKYFGKFLFLLAVTMIFVACGDKPESTNETTEPEVTQEDDFEFKAEQFADLKILRYQVPGFDELTLQEKKLLYYLYEAALSGRDIIYDQNYRHNIAVRKTLENIFATYKGDKSGENWDKFVEYAKRVFFANGIHHHYSTKKFVPEFDKTYFAELVNNSDASGFPMAPAEIIAKMDNIMFDAEYDAKRVNKGKGADLIFDSANNFYGPDIRQAEVEAFYKKLIDKDDKTPVSYGLNSKLVRENGQLVEKTYKVGGLYDGPIRNIVKWLEKAITVAENDQQKEALTHLVEFYKTGDLKKFDEYNIAWVKDTESKIDVINGFIEVYGDAMGYRGAFESVVQVTDPIASKRIKAISKEAQWFEDNSTIMDEHKKEKVQGISARVINVVMEAGDASPSTPIGINLPNANWIRAQHGSKSVNLANIVHAYDEAGKSSGMLQEFVWDEKEAELAKKYGAIADALHTDMHEVIGHASGKINPGVGTPKETLKSYSSTLEEARADLVALYYLMDQKLVDMGLMESLDVGRASYNDYIRNGLITQLRRIEAGEDLEEDHMRNRQLVAMWAMEKGSEDNVIERKERDGKTYFVINDYEKLRDLFGQLLREIQRIKSEGDFAAGEALVQDYGVIVDQDLRDEVHQRVEALNIAPYSGFINPRLVPVMDASGEITDVKVEYPSDFLEQHLEYGKTHSFIKN